MSIGVSFVACVNPASLFISSLDSRQYTSAGAARGLSARCFVFLWSCLRNEGPVSVLPTPCLEGNTPGRCSPSRRQLKPPAVSSAFSAGVRGPAAAAAAAAAAMAESWIPSPAPAEDSALVAKNWCYSRLKVAKSTFVWTINYFSLRSEEVFEPIESSEFFTGANDTAKWHLVAYPYGLHNECKNYLSIFLLLASCNSTEVRAKFKLAILNGKGEKTNQRQIPRPHTFFEGTWFGYDKFIERDTLLNEASGFLHDDTLSIFCEVTVLSESVNLSGQSHATHFQAPECRLSEDLGSLFESQRFSDVTLSVSGKDFQAHKAVLAARSAVFSAMFDHQMQEQKQNLVIITDVEPEVFREMLCFIYTGRVKSLENMAEDLLAAADKYALDKLKVLCEEALRTKLSADNAVDILILADLHSADQLKAQAIDFINTHATNVMGTQGWKQMILSHPRLITELFSALAARVVPLIDLS